MTTGIERIAAERKRQVEVEGWGQEHDDEHKDGELAVVAALYATPVPLYEKNEWANEAVAFTDPWPDSWDQGWDKRPRCDRTNKLLRRPTKTERLRMLEKAGALIAAEIDRLLRSPGQDRKGQP